LGFISEKEIKILYQNATALIMPTFLGQTNMPLMEAASLGCPIICSHLQGHYDLFGDTVLYINPVSYVDIAKKILLLNNTSQRNQLALAAKEKYLQSGHNVKNAIDILLKRITEFENI